MKCPFCGSEETQVIDTRANLEANTTRRRRKCASCEKRFTTYERVAPIHLMVLKVDGRREEFSRDKVYKSIAVACVKRPVTVNRLPPSILRTSS